MPLETIDRKPLKRSKTENHECLVKLRSKCKDITVNKIHRIIDETIDETVSVAGQKLVYTRTGFLLGHHSIAPTTDTTYLWNMVALKMIAKNKHIPWDELESKTVLRTIGALVMYRMSIRSEDWRVSFTDSGRYDFVTGQEIKIAQYFIPPGNKVTNTVNSLKSKWGGMKGCSIQE